MVIRIPRRQRGSRTRGVVLLAILLFVLSISTIVRMYTNLLWYQEIGFESVFWTELGAKVVLSLIFGLAFLIFSLVNLLIVTRLIPVYRAGMSPDDMFERYRAQFTPYLRWIAVGVSAVLAILFALVVTPYWDRVLLAMNAEPFGRVDPLFSKDIGFFVFRLPFFRFLYSWMFSALVIVTLTVALAHYLTGGIRPQSPGDRVTPQVKAHLSALIGLIVILRAWGYRLDQFDLVYSPRGEITGASYTDVHAELPALTLLIVISVIVAGLFLVNIRQRGWVLPLAGLGLWILIAIIARGAYPFAIQRFSVAPSQLQKETPYIKRNIDATRAAYGIEDIAPVEYPAITGITNEAIESNRATLENVRLWDPNTLADAYRSLQEIRTYYQFVDVDVDRYTIGGRLRQVMLSARELAQQNLENKSWQNLHLVYTHGYGAAVSPTNETTGEGHPAFIVRDVPPKTEAPELEIKQPAIYYGEAHPGYSVVNTGQQELEFGTEDVTRFKSYEGKGGIPLSGFLRRLAFAWRFRDINILISGLIKPESRIIFQRNIEERLELAAPFLQFDSDPYAVLSDDGVVWLNDAYTASKMYPYSERIDFAERTVRLSVNRTIVNPGIEGRQNYVRNSVKATVDSYDGRVKLYVWDEKDPIIRAWRKIFPDIFNEAAEMPQDLREHVRYPEDLFRVQTHMYRRYHMKDPRDFFTREDQWVIPRDPSSGSGVAADVLQEIQPYYILMKLPGENRQEYVLILPMNPKDRPNMVSWLAAKSGPDDYGKLIDFRFPKGRLIHGVGQIHGRIEANPEIARTISLLDQRGSKVIRGNLLVIPIEESLLYVRPLFVQSETTPLPELSNVILATSEKVVMGRSLEEALKLLLEGGQIVSEEPLVTEGATEDLIKAALDHLVAAEDAARKGDWATYGKEIQEARNALEEANRRERSSSPSPSPSPTR